MSLEARFSPPFAARVLRPRRAPFQQNRRGRSDCLGNSRVQHIISSGSSTGAELPRNTTRQLMHLGLLFQLARTSPDETKPSGRGLDRSKSPPAKAARPSSPEGVGVSSNFTFSSHYGSFAA